ncbi:LytTR family transcriptional regulator, partial [Rhodospirillum rubrum]|nr:LytTR family transcriptional regulator [Rhodospirillum rubrum]
MPDTPLLASSQPAAGRRALGLSARLAFAALAGGGGLAWIDRGDTALWLIAPALLWLQVLLTLAGVLALAGGSRLPGALIVALSAGLLVPPLTVEMRLLGFFLAAPPPDQSILTTAQYTLAGALAAGALAWILARRRFGRPPCSWTMLDCGGPGAEIDMDAALASLSAETLRRRDRAYIDAPPPLPFAPRG